MKDREELFKAFNTFIFSEDIKVIGKLLWRFKLFEMIKDLPGDIVEIGVFKGSGVATFQKFMDIFTPNTNRKVVGFDIFDADKTKDILQKDSDIDSEEMIKILERTSPSELSLLEVNSRLSKMNSKINFTLVDGDCVDTIPEFVKQNPGFRISFLYIDVDLERPVYQSLKHLWDLVVPGGIIAFDEYGYHWWSESRGVHNFLTERNIQVEIKSTNFLQPTAYIVKK
jgi:hypothetical protein